MPGDYPRCTTNSVACTSSYLVPGADCHVGGDVSLLYWPQSRRAGICSSDEIVTMGPTIAGQPNTAVWQNLTITSPTVWIIYSSLSAVDNCENTIGPVLTSGRIPMQSTDLSTVIPWFLTNIPWDDSPSGWINIARSTGVLKAMREEWTGIDPSYLDHHVPLTVADLAQPIPAAPYYQARVFHMDNACWSGGCPTIQAWGSNYAPVLALPSIATELRPEWLTYVSNRSSSYPLLTVRQMYPTIRVNG